MGNTKENIMNFKGLPDFRYPKEHAWGMRKVWKSARFPIGIKKCGGDPKGNLRTGWITRLYKENAKGILKILRLSNPPGGTRPVT